MPARLIAPSLGALNACCVGEEGSPYLQPHHWLGSVSYRYLHSFREFHGDDELPYPTIPALYANTRIHGFDLSATYQATSRFSLTLELPIQTAERKSYYEHDFVHLHTMRASGIGDLRLIGNFWVLDPERHRSGNISLGLGLKMPTGDDAAKDTSYFAKGPVQRPVDPAIQLGDGGWGIVTQLSAFQSVYKNTYAYLEAIYLINPRDSNGVEQTQNAPDFTLGQFGYSFNSVPDQYLARAGLGYVLWPKIGLSFTLGSRVEGVPVKDLIGDNHGWRTPGYAFYIEPGISISKGRYSFAVTGPVAIHRHANKNVTDIEVSKKFGFDAGAYAAFADYLITTTFSVAF